MHLVVWVELNPKGNLYPQLRGQSTVHDETGDGNCQARALADQLYGDQEHHAVVRSAMANRMMEDPAPYISFVDLDRYGVSNWDDFVRHVIDREGEWLDEYTIRVFSDAMRVNIECYKYEPSSKQLTMSAYDQNGSTLEPLRILNIGGTHYVSLKRR